MPVDHIASETSTIRIFWLYRHLPRKPEQAKTIRDIMKSYGTDPARYSNERKNLEHDLKTLRMALDDRGLIRIPDWGETSIAGKTARYYIDPDFALESVSLETIFFWEMLSNFTRNYLPVSIQQELTAKLSQLRQQRFMQQYQGSELSRWKQHIITVPGVLAAPDTDPQILKVIQTAILSGKVLEITYRKKWQRNHDVRQLYPVGLVFIDNMVHLNGFNPVEETIDDRRMLNENRNFAVNRIVAAQVMPESVPDWVARPEFSLDSLLKLGKLEMFAATRQISLTLMVHELVYDLLNEQPLSTEQAFERVDHQWYRMTARNVSNHDRLWYWLVSMSARIQVLEPADLRQAVHEMLLAGLANYDNANAGGHNAQISAAAQGIEQDRFAKPA